MNCIDQYKFNTYIKIVSNDSKKTFRVLLGNNFKNKKEQFYLKIMISKSLIY